MLLEEKRLMAAASVDLAEEMGVTELVVYVL